MQTVDERPETVHLYVVREEEPRPSLFPIILSVFALLILVAVGIAFPSQQPEERKTLRIPAVFLPLLSFSTSVLVVPTGVKTYPASFAHGTLTITNGSILSATFPKGIVFIGNDGVEVATDAAVFIPPGSASGYGYAQVLAHAVISGKNGNIPAFDINRIEGTSLFIRNITTFTGGKNSYSIQVETQQDRQTALDSAKLILASETGKIHDFLAFPCNETAQEKKGVLGLFWTCQFVTYTIPPYMKVTRIKLVGKNFFVDVVFVPRPRIIQFK